MDVFSAIANLVTSVVSRVWPDKTESDKQRFTLEIVQALQQSEIIKKQLDLDAAQAKVNEAQANNPNLFVSGSRPYIMWGLGTVLIIYFTLQTVANFAIAAGFHFIVMPSLDPMIRDIVLGVLGLGYLTRSYDKKNGAK